MVARGLRRGPLHRHLPERPLRSGNGALGSGEDHLEVDAREELPRALLEARLDERDVHPQAGGRARIAVDGEAVLGPGRTAGEPDLDIGTAGRKLDIDPGSGRHGQRRKKRRRPRSQPSSDAEVKPEVAAGDLGIPRNIRSDELMPAASGSAGGAKAKKKPKSSSTRRRRRSSKKSSRSRRSSAGSQ